VYQEVEKLKADGPTAQETSNVKALLLRAFETNARQNAFVLNQLVGKYQFSEDPAGVWALPDYYNKLDGAGIQRAARTYLDMNNRVQVTLLPEKK
jgi:zinc protease